ncbi:putative membrane protein [Mucinivorans hirudinis]|uniref:Putative membrane protein n=1 Tax=Mucinivorans hirudinis TaxID=1433126 RepID=A0A060R7X4_9BACT|nr:putative membrane protein [Mucinivorans hirudinis]
MKGVYTIILLIVSNIFMTFAWYGQLRMKEFKWFSDMPLFAIIALSWGVAFFEYCCMIPANRIGFIDNGGPFSLLQLKILQEVITLCVFVVFATIFFRNETFRINHLIGALFLVLAVYFIFKK